MKGNRTYKSCFTAFVVRPTSQCLLFRKANTSLYIIAFDVVSRIFKKVILEVWVGWVTLENAYYPYGTDIDIADTEAITVEKNSTCYSSPL